MRLLYIQAVLQGYCLVVFDQFCSRLGSPQFPGEVQPPIPTAGPCGLDPTKDAKSGWIAEGPNRRHSKQGPARSKLATGCFRLAGVAPLDRGGKGIQVEAVAVGRLCEGRCKRLCQLEAPAHRVVATLHVVSILVLSCLQFPSCPRGRWPAVHRAPDLHVDWQAQPVAA